MNSKMPIEIVHIHTNHTFVNDSMNFENENFKNLIIFIGEKLNYKGIYSNEIKYFNYKPTDLNKIIDICNNSSIIVLYNLDFVKSFIANRVNKDIIVCWRFFGLELYSRMLDKTISNLSFDLISTQKKTILENLRYIITRNIDKFRFKTTEENEFWDSVSRANYFLGLFKDEYDFLKKSWEKLPEFIQLPLCNNDLSTNPFSLKSNKIIVGNNRSAYNNHLDILKIILKYQHIQELEFILLFNYGQKTNYTKKVLNESKKIKNLLVINDFMSYNEFQKIYENTSALVINGYRQMAMGNIFTALRSGVKVYLNIKNITFKWLKNEGFLVFTMEDFEKDLQILNTILTNAEMEHNLSKMDIFRKKYNIEKFQSKILKSNLISNK
jgi:dTDP-N-acetylfucosamine:lipid II N-acetylfucosaminyltransferase